MARCVRRLHAPELERRDAERGPRGVAGPVLLLVGLMHVPASSASLLLNMEGVLTALLAWFVFRENFDRRIFMGMIFIVLAGIFLSGEQTKELGTPWGRCARPHG